MRVTKDNYRAVLANLAAAQAVVWSKMDQLDKDRRIGSRTALDKAAVARGDLEHAMVTQELTPALCDREMARLRQQSRALTAQIARIRGRYQTPPRLTR